MTVLSRIAGRLRERSDEELAEELVTLRGDLRAFRRLHGGKSKTDAHERVNLRLAELADHVGLVKDPDFYVNVAALAALRGPAPDLLMAYTAWKASRDPEFALWVHALVDSQPESTFSELDREAFEKEATRLEGEVRDREVELERREIDRQRTAAETELAALEAAQQ